MIRRSKQCIRKRKVHIGITTNTEPPNYDLQFSMAVDSSDAALCAVLFQTVNGIEHPTCFLSRKLRQSELNYSTSRKKLSRSSPQSVQTAFYMCYGSQLVTVYTTLEVHPQDEDAHREIVQTERRTRLVRSPHPTPAL